MATVCFTPFKIPRVRVTRLDSCGRVVTGDCSQVVSNGIISIEMTKNYEDREEFFVKNGDGTFCVRETNPPILKWIDLVLTFCNVDPDIVNIVSEGWTRLANQAALCTGGQEYGYFLWPWVVEGTIGDMTLENGVANFTVNARTTGNSLWGVGPYNIDYSDNPIGSTTPVPMNTPILSTQHSRMFITRLPPPAAGCGCAAV
jgi:hypothetical protein